MTEQEKSLALAKLMGWRVINNDTAFLFDSGLQPIMPYDTGATGLSQFAAILLKFPAVMAIIVNYEESIWSYMDSEDEGSYWNKGKANPTQATILDEILKLNGVEI